MREDARAGAWFARTFYLLMHMMISVIYFTYPNDFLTSCNSLALSFFIFWVFKISATYLFFTMGNDPGYIRDHQIIETDPVDEDWNPPEMHYCSICEITQPYRSKHCHKCEECVGKFDHHCFWIGGCVGELNHFRFCLYLVLESICMLWIANDGISGMGDDLEAYGSFVVSIAVTLGFSVLTIGLGVYHIYLISINSTTWEMMRRYKIDYIKIYPKNFNPFSKGFITNWKEAILHGNRLKRWDLPKTRPVYPFNWCDNEYWSCF